MEHSLDFRNRNSEHDECKARFGNGACGQDLTGFNGTVGSVGALGCQASEAKSSLHPALEGVTV